MRNQTLQEFERMVFAIAKDLAIPYMIQVFLREPKDTGTLGDFVYAVRIDSVLPRSYVSGETITIPLPCQVSNEKWFPMDANAEEVRKRLGMLKDKTDRDLCQYLYGNP